MKYKPPPIAYELDSLNSFATMLINLLQSFSICVYVNIYWHYGLGYQSSIPGKVILKTQKIVLYASLPNTQHYSVLIKGKWSNLGNRVALSPTHKCCSYQKRAFRLPSIMVNQLYIYTYIFMWECWIYIYIYIYICMFMNIFWWCFSIQVFMFDIGVLCIYLFVYSYALIYMKHDWLPCHSLQFLFFFFYFLIRDLAFLQNLLWHHSLQISIIQTQFCQGSGCNCFKADFSSTHFYISTFCIQGASFPFKTFSIQ